MLINRIGVEEFKRHAGSHPFIGMNGGMNRHIEHPICPRCEKIALRDNGWSKDRTCRCPSCGWKGRATVRLNEYIKEGMYRS